MESSGKKIFSGEGAKTAGVAKLNLILLSAVGSYLVMALRVSLIMLINVSTSFGSWPKVLLIASKRDIRLPAQSR